MYLLGKAKHNCNPQVDDGHNDTILNKKNNFNKTLPNLMHVMNPRMLEGQTFTDWSGIGGFNTSKAPQRH